MAVKVRGIYENGVVYLSEPLPAEFPADERREVEVVLEVAAPYAVLESGAAPVDDETAILAEMDRLNAELRALGDPADDTPGERARRKNLVAALFDLVPPLSDEEAEIVYRSIKRPMSMFALEETS